MNVTVARGALFALVILTASIYLPHFYDQLFVEPVARSHLLYSPVAQEFVYSEKIVGAIPPEVRREAKDYHAEIGWRTAGGRWISRPEFERLLPFIYYKNMELQGLLPVHIAGRSFDKEEIKKGRRVIEVKAREMKRPRTPIYPLIESKPGRAGLIFSKYRFSATADGLRLINADTNRQDSMLSTAFSARLQQRGFRFPIRAVFGRFTVLKPFDMGAFLLDSTGRLFHLSYSHGRPSVAAVELPEKVRVKYLKISESRRHRYCGVLIGEEGRVWLLACSDCRFVPLPVRGYDPEKMDLKLIFNPVSVTAVFSDEWTQTLCRLPRRAATSLITPCQPRNRPRQRLSARFFFPLFFDGSGRRAVLSISTSAAAVMRRSVCCSLFSSIGDG